jgi:hypothetical protein
MESYGRVFGYLPFSAGQFVVVLLPAAAVIYTARTVVLLCRPKNKNGRKRYAVFFAANTACLAGVLWLMYTLLCGLNYTRKDFASVSGLVARPSQAAELTALCEELAGRANAASALVPRDENGVMVLSADVYTTAKKAREAFSTLSEPYPTLGGFTPLPKPVLYSRLMSYVDITGMYFPFTMEANVNTDVPAYHIPFSMAHELAHFKGYMREDEANFIAWLACMASNDADFAYSGAVRALSYAANQLRGESEADYLRIMGGLDIWILEDFRANSVYWRQFEGPAADFSNSVNDAYLKSNRQADGVKSYGRMVDLLLADYRARHGIE